MTATAPATTARPAPTGSLRSLPVLSWALYDFANTVFSFAVITLYFNDWIVDQRGNPDWYIGAMGAVTSLVLVATMPAVGAIADRSGKRVLLLGSFTALCVVATVSLGFVGSTIAALTVAGIAIFCYQQALAQYDPLLASVAPDERRGRVSGLGVGLGYLGVVIAAVVLDAIVGTDKQDAFLPAGVWFGLFSIPILLFVRERATRAQESISFGRATRQAMSQLVASARHVRAEHRDVARFLIARFLYVDALATMITFMTIYMDRLGGFSDSDKTHVIAVAMIAAAIGAVIIGRLVERHCPRWALQRILLLVIITLTVAAAVGAQRTMVWVLGPLVGIGLGGVWTSDRVFMMRLSPPAVRGEFFALYNLIGRVSSGFGPLVLWGGSVALFHDGLGWSKFDASRIALVTLAIATAAGFLVLRPLSDAHKDWGTDPLEREIETAAV